MQRFRTLGLACCAWLVCSPVLPARAQVPAHVADGIDYIVDHWTTADGLPVNGVNGIHVSSSGYLWMATFDGLVRFDGHAFTTFRAGPRNPGMPGNRVMHMVETPDGQLWVMTEGLRLARFDGRSFHAVGTAQGLPGDAVYSLVVDADGELWVDADGGLSLRTQDDRFEPLVDGVELGRIHQLEIVSPRNLWIASDTGLHEFRDKSLHRRWSVSEGVPVPTRSFARDRDGGLWVAGGNELVRKTKGDVFRPVVDGIGAWQLHSADDGVRVSAGSAEYLVHADGRVERRPRVAAYFGTGYETVQRSAPDGSVWRNELDRITRDGAVVFSAPCKIMDFDFGGEGTVWVATACDGVYQLRPRRVQSLHTLAGIALGSVYGLAESADGALWIGTLEHGVAIQSVDGSVRWLDEGNGIPRVGQHALRVEPDGETWVGGCRLAGSECVVPADRPAALGAGTEIRASHRDRDGTSWFGGKELWYRTIDDHWHSAMHEAGLHHGPDGRVRVISESRDGTLWFGTLGQGVLRRDRDGGFRLFGTDDGLASLAIRALQEDAAGRLWVGTEDRGLCRFDKPADAAPRIDCIDSASGLWSDSIDQLLFDDENRAWINSNQGIFAVPVAALDAVLDGNSGHVYPQVYTERDGMPSREGNGGVDGAGIRMSDGRVAFPTQRGVAVFDPRSMRPAQARVRAVFEQVRLPDGRLLAADDEVRLPLGVRSFALRYTGLSPELTAPVYFRYRLSAAEPWIDLGESRQIDLSGLAAGDYPVELIAFNSGDRAGPVARITVHLPAYVHETKLFRFAAMLLAGLIGLFWLLYLRHTNRLRRRQLESTVAERTEALRTALDKVNEQRDEIASLAASKTRFFANVSHELRTPLALLVGPLDDFVEGRVPPPELVAAMQRNAHRLERLIAQLLDLERLDARRFPLRPQRVDLVSLVRESQVAFAALAAHEGISFDVHLPAAAVEVLGDPDQITRVLGNLLSNALKFCPAGGRVRLLLRVCVEGGVRVRVDDSGPGVPHDWRERIFDRFSQMGSDATRTREGAGLGLALCREVARLHGGRLYVTDGEFGGAGFVFELPLPERSPLVPAAGPVQPDSSAASTPPDADSSPDATRGRAGREPNPVSARHESHTAGNDIGQGIASVPPDRPLVLLAEDNADLRIYIADVLAAHYRVIAAEDGEAALALARSEIPDLVVTDLMMPRLDGLGLARALRVDPDMAGVPIVFLTARASDADRIQGLQGGADYYLTKPFDSRVLLAQLDAALRACRRLREHFAERAVAIPDGGNLVREEVVAPDSFAGKLRSVLASRAHDPAFGVPQLAAALHVSETSLRRRCQEHGLDAPGDCLRRHRLEQARELLRRHVGNVSEVAYAVGYSSLSSFSRAYRDHFGHSPGQAF